MQTREDKLPSFGSNIQGAGVGCYYPNWGWPALGQWAEAYESLSHGKPVPSWTKSFYSVWNGPLCRLSMGQLKSSVGAVFLSALGTQQNLLKQSDVIWFFSRHNQPNEIQIILHLTGPHLFLEVPRGNFSSAHKQFPFAFLFWFQLCGLPFESGFMPSVQCE